MVLTRIEPMSLAKIYAVIYAVIGLLIGLPAGCFFTMMGSALNQYGDAPPMAGLGFAVVIIYPIMAAVAGFIGGLIMAFVYNLVADKIGGVELEFDHGMPDEIL